MLNPGWNKSESPFHKGEQALQEKVGVKDKLEAFGRRVIRDHMPEQHRTFYQQLPYVFVGTQDEKLRPWASMLHGESGFMESTDPKLLEINALPLKSEPAYQAIKEGNSLGLLGLQFHSRRRNRMNGKISKASEEAFTIDVDQSFGNCPQYIQARDLVGNVQVNEQAKSKNVQGPLGDAQANLINLSDTFFIASQYLPDNSSHHGVDVSHRGGNPGFVKVSDDFTTLTWPDFMGNFHFNTLGNIELDPRTGLLFIDFKTGDLLTMTGKARVIWDGLEVEAFKGAERLVEFVVDEWIHIPQAYLFNWSEEELSPLLTLTGNWESTVATIKADAQKNTYQQLTVEGIVDETAQIKSFYLRPSGETGLSQFKAGQFLPIKLKIDGEVVTRTYTLSSSPNHELYRISVKREKGGKVSNFLHDHVQVGDKIQAIAPRGEFHAKAELNPVVLLSAGVGITPMISISNWVLETNIRTRTNREIYFIHGTQSNDSHAFHEETTTFAKQTGWLKPQYFYSNMSESEVSDLPYAKSGRITKEALSQALPEEIIASGEFYLCGPGGFVKNQYEHLLSLGVSETQIHYELFGPSSFKVQSNKIETKPAINDVIVKFSRSQKSAIWTPSSGSLLELAESKGLTPMFGCRTGSCGSCEVAIHQGKVHSDLSSLNTDSVRICCSVPESAHDTNQQNEPLILDL